jgi:N-carbamoyl-L-amino-acid hydrolase
MRKGVTVNGGRLIARLDAFAAIGGLPDGGVDRQALTEADRQARRLLADIAFSRGFEVYQDPAANLFVRRAGVPDGVPPLLIGSHLDSQPTGGRFDGALGTLSALEVMEALDDAGYDAEAPIELVVWTNEEGCRFAPGSMGSKAFVDGFLPAELLDAVAGDGARLGDELAATLDALPSARRRPLGAPIAGYIELHIEQGPVLELAHLPIGVVTGIQGVRWLKVRVTGEAGHAGTTPFSARRDPMMAACLGLAGLFARIMPDDPAARLTVGRLSVEPGSINAIPSAVTAFVDIRHPRTERLAELEAEIEATMGKAAADCGCQSTLERIFDLPTTEFEGPLVSCVEDAARLGGLASRRMLSGAFHDALFVARAAPSAMIFVPCRGGVSHNAREFVEPAHAVLGAEVLLRASLAALENGILRGPPGTAPSTGTHEPGIQVS